MQLHVIPKAFGQLAEMFTSVRFMLHGLCIEKLYVPLFPTMTLKGVGSVWWLKSFAGRLWSVNVSVVFADVVPDHNRLVLKVYVPDGSLSGMM